MSEEWRTPTVVALCLAMLNTRNFELLPILADALEDAGFHEDAVLNECRMPATPTLRRVGAERIVNLIYSEETALAVVWMDKALREMNSEFGDSYDYETAIRWGHELSSRGEMYFNDTTPTDSFRDRDWRAAFFHNWSIITGIAVRQEYVDSMSFRCAC